MRRATANVPEALVRAIRAGLSASRLRDFSPPARDRTITVTAENAPIPIVYGNTSIPGIIFAVGAISGDLVLGVAWGYGQFEAIDDVYINDEALAISGVTVTHYLGTTSQTVDSTLVSAVAAYNDDMILRTPNGNVGIAYSVFRIDPGAIDGSPRFQAVVRGRKVYDPRTDTTGYSANSALCWGDLATNAVFGMGRTVTGLDAAADWCDELLGGAVARCRLGLALTQPRRTTDLLDLLSTYGELIWYWEGADIVVIPDRAVAFDSIEEAQGQDALTYDASNVSEAYTSTPLEILADTDFSSTGEWTAGGGWEFGASEAYSIDPAADSDLSQPLSVSSGDDLVIAVTVDAVYAGSLEVLLDDESIRTITASGSYTDDFTAGEAYSSIILRADADFMGEVSIVSVKRETQDYFAGDYASDTASIYDAWTVGAGWAFRPLIPIIGVNASSSISQAVEAGGETKYVARFSILSRTAGTVALEFNGSVVISAKSAIGSYEVLVTGAFSGTDTFELVGSSFSGVVTPIELQRTVRLEDNCIAGTLSLEGVDDGDTPTKVGVRYTNSGVSSGYWPDALTFQSLPGVDEGEVPLVESTLSLPGVTRVEEANNKALARIEQMKNRVTLSWVTSDKGIVHRKGDVIRHRMTSRGTDILARIQSVQMISYGRYRVTGTRYDASHYPSELILPEDTGVLPVGAILPLSGSTIPDGWADYTAANGRYIIGAGGSYAVGATGGSNTFGGWSGNTSTEDMHQTSVSDTFLIETAGDSLPNEEVRWELDPPNTDHNHSYSTGTITPNLLRRNNRLVQKTGSAGVTIPKEVQVFGLPNLLVSGLSRIVTNANRLLVAAAANSNAGVSSLAVSLTTGAGGVDHDHLDSSGVRDLDLGPTQSIYDYETGDFTHTHSLNANITRNPKRKTLALWGSGGFYPIVPGMIVLWDDLGSIPTDWVLCNGANSTPDLRDYFIEIAPLDGEDVAAGNNTLSISGSTNNYGHHHQGAALGPKGTRVFSAAHSDTVFHNHSISRSSSWAPPYYALGAIMYSPS